MQWKTKKAVKPYKIGLYSSAQTIQTPLRTAFHDTQRLLSEAYSSNICSDSVLFAPLMKK